MADKNAATFDIGHPTPDAGRIGKPLMLFALGGAPLAWALQLLALASLAGFACPSGPQAAETAQAGWAMTTMTVVNGAALAVGLIALLAAVGTLRRTGGRVPKDRKHGMMNAGRGRSRYLAVWSIWTSVLFVLAIAVNTVSLYWGGGVCIS